MEPEEVERLLRKEWWLHHGCPAGGLYGDDGEMQCGYCFHDFKRESMDTLHLHVITGRIKATEAKIREIRIG